MVKTQDPHKMPRLKEDECDMEDIPIVRATPRKKHRLLIVCGILFLLVLALSLFLRSTLSKQRDMEQQLARQNEVIDGLTAKVNEQESIIKDSIPVITSETLKESLSAISELVTQQYIYTNADKYEADQTWIFGWKRPFSSKSILITYNGIIKAGIDLSEVVFDVNDETHTITVSLPESRITDNNIPQESIVVVEVKDGLFNEVTLDDYNQFISEQKIVMENRAIDQGLLNEATKQARELISSMLKLIPGIDKYTIIIN